MIANKDETLVWADTPNATTIVKRGTHTVPITQNHRSQEKLSHSVFGCESRWNKNETLHCDPSQKS